jgi:LmbE family N-acetylglucosaminyl deacetylase
MSSGGAVFTLVSFHAHPDDEVLLTGGTLARAAGEGHRVVLVTATDGGAGLSAPTSEAAGPVRTLGARRVGELRASAAALGCARVELLGYADSGSVAHTGSDGPVVPDGAFCAADVEDAAQRLAAILIQERADALTIYDPVGGYGHPDHVQVHRVGLRAAALAGTLVVLEATADRRWLARAGAVLGRLSAVRALGRAGATGQSVLATAYTAPGDLTHRVDVRAYAAAKRAAMQAHASQAGGGDGARTLALLLRLPRPVFARVLGREWFVEHGRPAASDGAPLLDDIFASLR